MDTILPDEYLALLKMLADTQYDEEEYVPEPEPWMDADSQALEKMRKARVTATELSTIDMTDMKSAKIKDMLTKHKNIKVGNYSIKIRKYDGHLHEDPNHPITVDVEVWIKKFKTDIGNPCNMDYRVDFSKDSRFAPCAWLKHFKGSSGTKIPLDTLHEIIRWLQAIKRLSGLM